MLGRHVLEVVEIVESLRSILSELLEAHIERGLREIGNGRGEDE